MDEPEIGWVEYFINHFVSNSLVDEVINHMVDYELEPTNFDTRWLDYDYNGDLSD